MKGQQSRRGFDDALPIALLRARDATMRNFKPHLDNFGLTQAQWRVLRALADDGPLDASTLAERCVILAPSLTRIIKSHMQQGLVAQKRSSDARRKVIVLTEKGQAMFDEAFAGSLEIYRDLEAAFGGEKMDTLLELLNELRETAEALSLD